MSLDLRLLVIDSHLHGMEPDASTIFSHTMLSMDRSALFEDIGAVEKKHGRVVKDLRTWGNDTYGKYSKTPFGDKLRFVKAKHLKHIYHEKKNEEAFQQESRFNQSIWMFLASLPEKTPIALWWH